MILVALLFACTPDKTACVPADEVPYDGVDQDCDGVDLLDVDGDGVPSPTDCDDADPDRAPGRTDTPGDGVDQDCDGLDAVAAGTRSGTGVDSGFGTALALDGTAVLVGAPFFRVDGAPGGQLTRDGGVVSTGSGADRLGRALLRLDDGTLRVGAPGAGEVRDGGGAVVFAEAGVGRVLAGAGTRWVAGTRRGARWDDGTEVDLGGAPDALSILPDGTLVAGFAHGDVAVWIGDVPLPRPATDDEAGFALAAWTPHGDGRVELLVGAPGAGRVWRVDPDAPAWDTAVEGAGGRFGAAIGAWVDRAWVGAPMEGTTAEGAVWRLDGTTPPTRSLSGRAPGDQLGAAIVAGPTLVVAGAPGRADAPGSVEILLP